MTDDAISVDLTGVPETLLWPLYARAAEARRSDALLDDPKAIELVDAIDYPFEQTFGGPQQVLALRELSFDGQVAEFLARHPKATVVALADGLNTQFWRIDNGTARWLSVDLPEVIAVRSRLLPDTERARSVSCSALDDDWMDLVDPEHGVMVTAQGLFMYLTRSDVFGVIHRVGRRFPGATMLFDAMPRLFTAAVRGNTITNTFMMPGKRKGADAYKFPPMPWSSTFEAMRRELLRSPDVADVTFVGVHRGRGFVYGSALPLTDSIPYVRSLTPWYALVRFHEVNAATR